MRFELFTAGTAEESASLGIFETFTAARVAYDATPADGEASAWHIKPVGTSEELAALGSLYSINPRYGSAGCFIIGAGGGFSCLGFEVVENTRRPVVEWLAREGVNLAPFEGEAGTPAAFMAHREALEAARVHFDKTGRRCPAELTPQLIGKEGARVEVVDSYGETRRFTVGRSSGWIPCHLELASKRASGGASVSGAPFQSVRVLKAAA